MLRWSWALAALVAVPVLLLAIAGPSYAQTVVVAPAPTVPYYTPPVVVQSAPTVTYYTPPPVVTYSSPVVVAPAPATTVTTYRYGILHRRVVVRSYTYPAPAPAVTYYAPPPATVTYYAAPVYPRRTVVRYYYP
jgi:hypothetical protein